MIRLFDRDETNFDHNETPLPDVLSATVEVEVNGMYEVVLDYPRNAFAKTLTAGKIIKAPTPDGEQLFRIYKPIKNLKTYKIYARHIFYDLAKNFIENVRPTTTSGSQAIASILNGSTVAHGFTGYSDISDMKTANYVRMNPVQALMGADNAFLNVWGGELTRDNYTFRIDAQGGQDRGYEVRLGKNLIGIEADIDESNVYTCIYPTVVIDGNVVTTLPEKYVYSPLVNSYESTYVIEERIDLTDEEKELPLESIYTLMRNRAAELFEQGADKPEVNYKVDFVELSKTEQYEKIQILEQLNLYDTVDVIVDELDIRVKARVIKFTYDALRERYESMELGNFKQSLASQAKNTLGMVDKQITQANNTIREAFELSNELITGNLGGHIITRRNAEGLPYEQLIMDTDDIQTATNVIRMNQQGIGFSDTGYNGPFGVAITIDGKLNAEIINVLNMNVDNLVGNTSTFVQSAWNGINNQIGIGNDGISVTGFGGGRRNILTSTGIDFHDLWGTGGAAGYMGYFSSAVDGVNERMQFDRGTNPRHVIGIAARARHDIGFGYSTADPTVFDPAVIIDGIGGGVRVFTGFHAGNGNSILTLQGRTIAGQSGLTLQNRGSNDTSGGGIHMTGSEGGSTYLMENGIWRKFYSEDTPRIGFGNGSAIDYDSSKFSIKASGNMELSSNSTVKIALRNTVDVFTNISMGGNDIVNQSDERLKENIVASDYDALELFRNLTPKKWEWIDKERFGKQTDIGFIAQELKEVEPRLVTQVADESTDDGCAWVVNETEMNRRAWVALNQLIRKVDELDERTSTS